ncbi:MAG: hypothetical protein M1281_03340 [Chloroflexi bacterium]|nr:hypothetical protein [Chloroflexota bacterium]
MLYPDQINAIGEYINTHCRPLERARFNYLFGNGTPGLIVEELRKYQNPDGGFGNGLEPDFFLPDSSPMATSIAFQILGEIPGPDEEIIRQAIGYLEHTYTPDRPGWLAVPEAVNQYPRAVWWNWDREKQQTVIDANWGNPSAEIIGYLSKYREYAAGLHVDALVEHALAYWENRSEFPSEHETYCFLRLHRDLPPEKARRLEKGLIKAAESLVVLDPGKWGEYTPQPVHFADTPDSFLYEVVKDGIEANLNYLISSIHADGIWAPNWTWYQYEDTWPQSRVKWEGILAIRNLRVLSVYACQVKR